MDVEKLIILVQERQSLWDQKSKQYSNRELNKKLWKEIGEKMNVADDIVRQKWRGLRDTFRKELVKLQQKRSGDSADEDDEISKWKFFDNMLFIKDFFVARKTSGNISRPHTSSKPSETDQMETPSDIVYSDNEQSQTETENTLITENEPVRATSSPNATRPPIATNPESSNTRKRKITGRDATMQQLLAIEQRKLDHFQRTSQQHEDDDTYFVLSLVPYMKQLPTHRKLYVRTKFQELLMNEHELITRSHDTTQAVLSRQSRQYTTIPTPSPAYSSSSTDFSQPPSVQSVNDSTFSSINYDHPPGSGTESNFSHSTQAYFSNFQPDIP